MGVEPIVTTHLPKVKWTRDNLVRFILGCRRDKGLPIFKTKFAGFQFEVDNKPAVMAVCWAGQDMWGSQMFVDVPKEDIKLIEEGTGDWRRLIEKYGTPEEIKMAKSGFILIRSVKLPAIGGGVV